MVPGVEGSRNARRLPVDRFPCHVWMVVDDELVYILAGAHDRRRRATGATERGLHKATN
jgi:hypothetical protein